MGGTLVLDLATSSKVDATVCYYGSPARGGDKPISPPRPLDLADRVHGRVLGLWGDQDTGVGIENVEALRKKFVGAKVAHEFRTYPGLGHGFLRAFLEDGFSPGYRHACESWTRALDFSRRAERLRRYGPFR